MNTVGYLSGAPPSLNLIPGNLYGTIIIQNPATSCRLPPLVQQLTNLTIINIGTTAINILDSAGVQQIVSQPDTSITFVPTLSLGLYTIGAAAETNGSTKDAPLVPLNFLTTTATDARQGFVLAGTNFHQAFDNNPANYITFATPATTFTIQSVIGFCVNKVFIKVRTAGTTMTVLRVETSNDGVTFTDLFNGPVAITSTTANPTVYMRNKVVYKYYRFSGTFTGPDQQVDGMQLYGSY